MTPHTIINNTSLLMVATSGVTPGHTAQIHNAAAANAKTLWITHPGLRHAYQLFTAPK